MPFVEVLSGSHEGDLLILEKKRTRLGKKSELRLSDPWISAEHADIFFNAGSYWLEDLDSSNGTFVEKAKIRKVQLQDGSEFHLGKTHCRFLLKAPTQPGRSAAPAAGTAVKPTLARQVEQAASHASRAADAAESAARDLRRARPGVARRLAGKLAMPVLLLLLLFGGGVYLTLPLRTNEARLLLLAEYSKLRPIGQLVIHRTAPDTTVISLPDQSSTVRRFVGISEVGLRFVVFPDAQVYQFQGLEDWWRALMVYWGEPLTTGTRVAIVQIAYGDERGSRYDPLQTPLGDGEALYKLWEESYGSDDNTLNSSFIPIQALPLGETRRYNLWGDQRGAFVGLKPEGWTPPQQGGNEEEGGPQ